MFRPLEMKKIFIVTFPTYFNKVMESLARLGVVHLVDAKETIARIISYFPEAQQHQVRAQLAANLTGIISQRLVKRKDRRGLVLAPEVLVNTPTIRSAILENRLEEIPVLMAKQSEEYGMQTFDQAAVKLFKAGLINEETARATATNPSECDRAIKFTG